MEWSLTGLPLPIVLRPPSPLTDDELMEFSRVNHGLRIEKNAEGELLIMTPLGGESGNWGSRVIRSLDVWAEEDGRGLSFSSDTGFHLPDGSVLSPDASWVSLDRWQVLTQEQRRKFPPLCPEFVVELRSSTDSLRPLQIKMERYLANGAQLAWLIDPYEATVAIYGQGHGPEVLRQPTQVDGEGPVAGFRLMTARLWAK